MLSEQMQRFKELARDLPIVDFNEDFIRRNPAIGRRKQFAPVDMVLMHVDGAKTSTSKTVFGHSARRVSYADGMTDEHRHDFIELVYIYEGIYRFQAYRADDQIEELTLQAKELCLIDPELLHRESTDREPFTAIFVCMSKDFFDNTLLSRLASQKAISAFVAKAIKNPGSGEGYLRLSAGRAIETVERCLDAVLQEVDEHAYGYDYLCRGYMTRIIETLTPEVYDSLNSEDKQSFQQQFYAQLMEYMTEHACSVTPEDLVREFHFQKDYFTRLFRKHAGKSFTEVRQELRLQQVAQGLAESEESISELMAQAGYRNATHFYKVFSERFGTTPAAYREQKKSSQDS